MRSCVCALVQHNRQLTQVGLTLTLTLKPTLTLTRTRTRTRGLTLTLTLAQVFARILLARVSANHLRPTVAALKQLAQLMDVTQDEPLPGACQGLSREAT